MQKLQGIAVSPGVAIGEALKEAVARVEAAIESGQREILVAMATGTGKTYNITSIIVRLVAERAVKMREIVVGNRHVEIKPRHAERIALLSKREAALRIGRQLHAAAQ